MPGDPQFEVISHHDVKSLPPTHNWYQLLSLHQTFAGRVALEACSAPALPWLLAPSLALSKPGGSSSWGTAPQLASSLPHAELNLYCRNRNSSQSSFSSLYSEQTSFSNRLRSLSLWAMLHLLVMQGSRV